MNEFEYYLIGRDGNASAPLLRADEDQTTKMLYKEFPYEGMERIQLCLRNPIPKNPQMLDYHSLPYTVISKKIFDILEPMNIYGVQYIPVTIRNQKDGERYDDYFVVHVYNHIECLDRTKAEYTISEHNLHGIGQINKLVLDQDLLERIPLEKRLVFYLKEDISKRIYHKSIVDAVMAIEPEGLKFKRIENWYEGIQFQR